MNDLDKVNTTTGMSKAHGLGTLHRCPKHHKWLKDSNAIITTQSSFDPGIGDLESSNQIYGA